MHKYDVNMREFLDGKKIKEFGLQKRLELAIKVAAEVAKVHKTGIVHS